MLSSNDTLWCVICLAFIGNGFPEFANTPSPGFAVRGAVVTTLGEGGEPRPEGKQHGFHGARLWQGSWQVLSFSSGRWGVLTRVSHQLMEPAAMLSVSILLPCSSFLFSSSCPFWVSTSSCFLQRSWPFGAQELCWVGLCWAGVGGRVWRPQLITGQVRGWWLLVQAMSEMVLSFVRSAQAVVECASHLTGFWGTYSGCKMKHLLTFFCCFPQSP